MEKARGLHLAGWVKNLPNRTVEVEAEGDEDSLQQLEQILWKGPTLSRVEDVKATYSDNVRGHKGFQIG